MKTSTLLQSAVVLLALGLQPAEADAQTPVELEVDLLEVHLGRGDDHLLLDSTLTLGEGSDQFLVKLAGGSDTRTAVDDVEIQALYSRSLSGTAALHLGMRHDVRAGSNLSHGVAGLVAEIVPGLEAEHYVFVSQHGDLTGGGQILFGAELTPRLELQPRFAFGWSAQDVFAEALGSGLTEVEASLRLRRSLSENFDVYVGAVHERLLGQTRRIALEAGDPARVTRAVIGFGLRY